jgi:hypothetical protein
MGNRHLAGDHVAAHTGLSAPTGPSDGLPSGRPSTGVMPRDSRPAKYVGAAGVRAQLELECAHVRGAADPRGRSRRFTGARTSYGGTAYEDGRSSRERPREW